MTVREFLSKSDPGEDQYIVLPDKIKKETESGIVIPDSNKAEERTQIGEIVAVGPGRIPDSGTDHQPMQYKKGDRVVFRSHAGDDLIMDDDLNIYPFHVDLLDQFTFVRVLRQPAILFKTP